MNPRPTGAEPNPATPAMAALTSAGASAFKAVARTDFLENEPIEIRCHLVLAGHSSRWAIIMHYCRIGSWWTMKDCLSYLSSLHWLQSPVVSHH
jgi:hypothetical protein